MLDVVQNVGAGLQTLHTPSRPYTDEEYNRSTGESLVDRDASTLIEVYKSLGEGCVGLALPQIGIHRQMFVALFGSPDYESENLVIVTNPQITVTSNVFLKLYEACASVNHGNLHNEVESPIELVLSGRDVSGAPYQAQLGVYNAKIAMHEFNHLDGGIISDDINFVGLTTEEVEAEYSSRVSADEEWYKKEPYRTTSSGLAVPYTLLLSTV